MIPAFPKFKKLSLSDKAHIEAHTKRHPPYSDFNFTSLWAWDTSEQREISELNGSLVVRFTDYTTHEPFLSVLGIEAEEKTALALLEFSAGHSLPRELRLVPEEFAKKLGKSFSVREDRDNFDYVYSITDLVKMAGPKFASKRQSSTRFKRAHHNAHLEILELGSGTHQTSILQLVDAWERNKIDASKDYELQHELESMRRIFGSSASHTLILSAIFADDGMHGFCVDEKLPNEYAIGHYWKCDVSGKGAYEFLMREKARHLETLGVSFLNYEQDLGIPSLRTAKMSFRPAQFLKKFTVSLAQ